MTKFAPVTDNEIRQLRIRSFAAGDDSQGFVCHLALCDEYTEEQLTDVAWLNDNVTTLTRGEILELESITQADARRICERVIGTQRLKNSLEHAHAENRGEGEYF